MFPTQQVMTLTGSPTYKMTLSQRLRQQAADKNDGTVLGGLGSLADEFLANRAEKRDKEEAGKLSKALMEGLTKSYEAGTPEELGGEGLTTMEPGVDNALRRIAETGLGSTERGGRLTQMLAMQRLADQRQQAALADQRAYAEKQTQGQREWQAQQEAGRREWQAQQEAARRQFQLANRPAPKPQYMRGADGYIYDMNTRQRALPGVQAAQEPLKAPTVRTITQPDGSEVAVQFNGQTGQWDRLNAPEGGAAIADPRKKLTENQAKLTLFQSQITQTSDLIDKMETELGYDPTNLGDAAARSVAPNLLAGFFKTEQGQQYQAMSEAWSEGVLRIQTGAAATQPETERVQRTYFPVPGDSPATVALKRAMRGAYGLSIEAALGGEVPQGATDPMVFAVRFMRANKSGGPMPKASGDIGNGITAAPGGRVLDDPLGIRR